MDQFGFDQTAAWLAHRVALPPGPLFCVIDGATRGRRWAADAARAELRQLAVDAGVRRRFGPHQLRHAHAVELAREGVAVNIIQRQLGHTDPGDHQHLPAGDRSQRDHRRRPLTPPADDLRHRRADPLIADHDEVPPVVSPGEPRRVTCLHCRSLRRQPGCGSVPRAARSATKQPRALASTRDPVTPTPAMRRWWPLRSNMGSPPRTGRFRKARAVEGIAASDCTPGCVCGGEEVASRPAARPRIGVDAGIIAGLGNTTAVYVEPALLRERANTYLRTGEPARQRTLATRRVAVGRRGTAPVTSHVAGSESFGCRSAGRPSASL